MSARALNDIVKLISTGIKRAFADRSIAHPTPQPTLLNLSHDLATFLTRTNYILYRAAGNWGYSHVGVVIVVSGHDTCFCADGLGSVCEAPKDLPSGDLVALSWLFFPLFLSIAEGADCDSSLTHPPSQTECLS
jgi:hypothetical protein